MAVIEQRKQAAAALGISERSLGFWKNEEGFPDCSAGHDIEAIKAWRDARERKGSEAGEIQHNLTRSIKREKRREMLLKNKRLKMEIARLENELLPREVFHQLLMECAALINGVASQQRRMGNPTAADMIDEQMDRMRKLVHDRLADARKSDSK